MKSAVSIFFLILVVSVQTPVGQLFKLPVLIEHFIKHQKQEGLSLIEFLGVHYKTVHNDADSKEDEQLPFKSIAYYNIGTAIVPKIINTNFFVLLCADKKIFFPDITIPQQHLARIFHPPRV